MFGLFNKIGFFVVFILLLFGCGVPFSEDAGFDPTEILVLDDKYDSSVSLEKGEIFALDMRIPLDKGYEVIGASFDPVMLRLEHYLKYDEEGTERVVYMFSALMKGITDVLVKMKSISGGEVEIYKRVSVKVGGDDNFF
jgi:hypothetical protein